MSGTAPGTGPSVTPPSGAGMDIFKWSILIILVILLAMAALYFRAEYAGGENVPKERQENRSAQKPGMVTEGFNPPARSEPAALREAAKPATGTEKERPRSRLMPSPMVAYAMKPPAPPPAVTPAATPAGPEKPATLAGMPVLQVETIDDPSWFLMPGNMIQCLNTQPLTERSGAFWNAKITEEVRGQDGTRILIPRYSDAFGRILKGFEFGERRLAAVLTHIQGPSVPGQPTLIIPLGLGQVGDALGRIDLEGNIETHFWSRLGTVAMYAGLDAIARVGSSIAANELNNALNGNNKNGTNTNVNVGNFGGLGTGRGLAGSAMDEELRRPPNFDRPQNFPCSIMVTQPIDFRKRMQIGNAR